ncbi:hypothetical protein VKS41_004024 [Umbelopsis sp. WA50703]
MSKRPAAFKSDEKKKKAKSYQCAKDRAPRRGGMSLQPNWAGVMVMCARKKEDRAVREALDMFNHFADQLYPDTEAEGAEKSDEDDEEQDIEAAIAKEVNTMSKKPKSEKRFANITTDTDCVAFIRTNPPVNPVDLVHHIMLDIKATQNKRARFISRLLPIEKSCNSNEPEIIRMAQELLKPHFHTPTEGTTNVEPKKFSIVCRIRNCQKIDRQDLTKTIAGLVGKEHQVDLVNPELVIIVEVLQTICMMSVVKDFYELKKYNIESLCGLNDKKEEK